MTASFLIESHFHSPCVSSHKCFIWNASIYLVNIFLNMFLSGGQMSSQCTGCFYFRALTLQSWLSVSINKLEEQSFHSKQHKIIWLSYIMFLSLMGSLYIVCVFLIMDFCWVRHPLSSAAPITGKQVIPVLPRSPVHLYPRFPVALTGVAVKCSLILGWKVNMAPSFARLWHLNLELCSPLCYLLCTR